MRINFEPNRHEIRRLVEDRQGSVFQGVRRASGRTRDRAKVNITRAGRVDTGNLRRSIRATEPRVRGRKVVAQIGSPLKYAWWQHEGTEGPIYPRRARVLRFRPKGSRAFIFRPRVSGIEGEPFLTDALDDLTVDDFTPR